MKRMLTVCRLYMTCHPHSQKSLGARIAKIIKQTGKQVNQIGTIVQRWILLCPKMDFVAMQKGKPMNLIEKQAAIDACLKLSEARRKWDTAEGRAEMRGIDAVMCAIHDLPSAQSERKRGAWINDRGLYKCSCCKQLWAEWWVLSKPIERMRKEMPYCPMCGSYNGGEVSD